MADTIRGKVTKVRDGDTFELKLTHVGRQNEYNYNRKEVVRLPAVDAPELHTRAGKAAKRALEKQILGKEVRVNIRARDRYHRVIGSGTVI